MKPCHGELPSRALPFWCTWESPKNESGNAKNIAASAYQAGADHFLTKPGRLSRVKFILETLYVATASKAKGYSPLMALPEYLQPDLAALSASHHQPGA